MSQGNLFSLCQTIPNYPHLNGQFIALAQRAMTRYWLTISVSRLRAGRAQVPRAVVSSKNRPQMSRPTVWARGQAYFLPSSVWINAGKLIWLLPSLSLLPIPILFLLPRLLLLPLAVCVTVGVPTSCDHILFLFFWLAASFMRASIDVQMICRSYCVQQAICTRCEYSYLFTSIVEHP